MEAAEQAALAFYAEVSVLREKHRIPEALIVVGMYVSGQAESQLTVDACSFGDPHVAPILAAVAWREYTAPTVKRAEELKKIAGKEES